MTGDTDSFRWRLESEEPDTLFPAEYLVERHVGTGEYRGLEFLQVNAKRVINEVPRASRMPFRYTINAYRGCSHACSYCASGETRVLMADGRHSRLADVRVGDQIYGTAWVGGYRRYARTTVLAHWSTVKRAYRVTLEDGTELIASADHRFLSDRGWKHVTAEEHGRGRRPHLTTNNELVGTGSFAEPPENSGGYRSGYLCGMIRGDGTIGHYLYRDRGRDRPIHLFRRDLIDMQGLRRTSSYLSSAGMTAHMRVSQAAAGAHKELRAIHTGRRLSVEGVEDVIRWPETLSADWAKGFLAGIFDAEGNFGQVVRIADRDPEMTAWTRRCMDLLGFRGAVEPPRTDGVRNVRLLGGLREVLRFFHTVDPAVTRKREISGRAVKGTPRLRVVSIEDLGVEIPMYDITTGTGDFIANGVVSHNCFARPTHEYLGLNIGEDFERKIVVKVNAVERARAELRSPKWRREHIAMGTNTDPYQKAEGKYHLTRGIIQVLAEAANPFSILTKSTLMLRDLDVLTEAAAHTPVHLTFSIGTLDRDVWRLTEPGTPPPDKRVEAVRRFNQAGIPCGVLVAPVLPGLSDQPDQIRAVVEASADAGATSISAIPLHLRPGVREHYLDRLARARPDLVALNEQRFRLGSYQARTVQHDISQVVTDVLARRGPLESTPYERRTSPPSPPPVDESQLKLNL
jgi:DNA repair photolyase